MIVRIFSDLVETPLRRSNRVHIEKQFPDYVTCHVSEQSLSTFDEPMTVKEALASPKSKEGK